MYEDIREWIKIGKKEKQQILIIGDFNANIGAARKGNKTQATEGVRQLLQLANKKKNDIKYCQRKVQRWMDQTAERRKRKVSNWLCSDKFNKYWHSKGNKNRWKKII